jgi:hypothetical protein
MKKNTPIYSFDEVVELEEGKKTTFRIQIKAPTRSMLQESDLFYAINFNKYIKLGLLTAEQVAKRQIDIGGTFTDEQRKNYAKIQAILVEKEEMYYRLMEKKYDELTDDEVERKKSLIEDLANLRTQVAEYEYIRTSVYDQTANAKARNESIMWWVLNLATFTKVEEGKEPTEFAPLFKGEDFATKKLSLEEYEDNEDKLVTQIFSKLAKIITFWYWMGVSDRDKLKELLAESQ